MPSINLGNIKNEFLQKNLSNKFLGMPRIKSGAAGWEAQTLSQCYAAPTSTPHLANSFYPIIAKHFNVFCQLWLATTRFKKTRHLFDSFGSACFHFVWQKRYFLLFWKQTSVVSEVCFIPSSGLRGKNILFILKFFQEIQVWCRSNKYEIERDPVLWAVELELQLRGSFGNFYGQLVLRF